MTSRSLLLAFMVLGTLSLSVVSSSEAADDPQQLRAACEKGTARACADLGQLYSLGESVKQNNFQAVSLFRKACDSGDTLGCGLLGIMYEHGQGVRQDNAEALKYYGKVCDLHEQVGCDNYARMKSLMGLR